MIRLQSNFQKSLFLISVLSSILLASCSKKEEAAPTIGAISGTISPAEAATSVIVSDQYNHQIATTVPDAKTGTFTFSNLNVGGYVLSLVPFHGYKIPDVKSTAVVGGQTTNVGMWLVEGDGTPHGLVSWRVNGVTYQTNYISGYIRSDNIAIDATATNGTTQDAVSLRFRNNNYQPGNYVVTRVYNDPYAFGAYYARFENGVVTIQYNTSYYTPPTQSTGALSITAFSQSAKTIQGEFSFFASPPSAGGAAAPVTDGTFNLHY